MAMYSNIPRINERNNAEQRIKAEEIRDQILQKSLTFRSYADILECSYCKKVYDIHKSARLTAHELKHQKTEQTTEENRPRIFKKKEITYKRTPFEKAFGIPLYRPFFLAFDFEAIHQPIAVVINKDFSYKFIPLIYCGEDSGQQMIKRLEEEAEIISQALKSYLFSQYAIEWSILENSDKCKFQTLKIKIIKDFCKIPILGFNSGKYDMTFIIQHMINPLFPIGNIITKSKGS